MYFRVPYFAVNVLATMMVAGVFACAVGSEVKADPLSDALTSTYNTNPQIKAKREALAELDEIVSEAIGGWRPNLSASYEKGRQRTRFNGSPWRTGDTADKQLVLEQPIFSGGETVARIKSAKAAVKSGRAELLGTEQDTLLAAVKAYMDVVQAQSVLDLSRNNADVLGEQSKATKDRFDVGDVTRTDVAQANSRLSTAHAQVTQAAGDLEAARATFARVVGYAAPANLPLPSVKPPLPGTLEESDELALANNPLIDFAHYRHISAQNDVNVSTARILPSVSVRGSLNRQDGAGVLGTSQFDTDAITLNVSIPLYQSGAEYSRVRQAEAVADQLKFEEKSTDDQVKENVRRAWELYKAARSTIHSTQDAIEAAQIALDGVKQEQQYGARTVLDVLDAEQEFFTRQVDLVRAQHNDVVAQYSLLSAVGKLTAQDLALPVEYYDPQKHYDEVKYKLIGF